MEDVLKANTQIYNPWLKKILNCRAQETGENTRENHFSLFFIQVPTDLGVASAGVSMPN